MQRLAAREHPVVGCHHSHLPVWSPPWDGDAHYLQTEDKDNVGDQFWGNWSDIVVPFSWFSAMLTMENRVALSAR